MKTTNLFLICFLINFSMLLQSSISHNAQTTRKSSDQVMKIIDVVHQIKQKPIAKQRPARPVDINQLKRILEVVNIAKKHAPAFDTVPNDATCGICQQTVEELNPNEILMTKCCKNIICKEDFDRLEKDARELYHTLQDPEGRQAYARSPDFHGWPDAKEHAACPYCRHYPLEVKKLNIYRAIKECGICLDEKNAQNFRMLHCQHEFCKDCLQNMVDMAIQEKNSTSLKCPHANCGQPFTEQDIRMINNDQRTIDAIAEIKLYEFLATQPHAKHCPTPNCNYVFINEENLAYPTFCPQCHQEYCANCLLKHDPQISCAQAMQPTDRATAKFMQMNVKECPQCHALGKREEGCNYVQCPQCRHGYCWECLNPHDHRNHLCAPTAPHQSPASAKVIQPNAQLPANRAPQAKQPVVPLRNQDVQQEQHQVIQEALRIQQAARARLATQRTR